MEENTESRRPADPGSVLVESDVDDEWPSPDIEDWDRERFRRFSWQPARQLIRTIRAYQACRARRDLLSRLLAYWYVLEHRFWMAITGADIPLHTTGISGGLLLPHPSGVVIHPDAVMGPNCTISQQVTLGVGPRPGAPRLGGAIEVGPGAKILGGVIIGDHALIEANAVVVDDVPHFHTAAGSPAICRPRNAPRGQDVPLDVLESWRAGAQPVDMDLAAAHARGRTARMQLLQAEGGVVTSDELGRLLGGISPEAIDWQRKTGRLLAVPKNGDWLYPRWQVQGGQVLEGLEEVLQELRARDHDVWAILIFFLHTDTANENETPLQALRSGRVEAALRAARTYGEQGAR